MPPRTALRAGDRVAVPWGVDTRAGEISAVYDTGDVERVLVMLDVSESGQEEPQTIVLAADDVRLLSEEPDLPAPGTWLRGFRYERDVAEALRRVLRNLQPTVKANLENSGNEIDALVESPRGTIVVEVKAAERLPDRVFKNTIQRLLMKMRTFPNAKGLLVTPSPPPRPDGMDSPDIRIVRWRGPRDDKQLERVARDLLDNHPSDLANTGM